MIELDIGVINAGSSSLKMALFSGDNKVLSFLAENLNVDGKAKIKITDDISGRGHKLTFDNMCLDGHGDALGWIFQYLQGYEIAGLVDSAIPKIIGHRVVHGGTKFKSPIIVDAKAIKAMRALIPLAPLHQPHNVSPIEFIMKEYPNVVQVACFDTAFHAGRDDVETEYAIPKCLTEMGIRSYGFHGISYEYIAKWLGENGHGGKRVVACHLGGGGSLCAMKGGRSVSTTMGFSTLAGLPMGTRCGDIDPGVLLYMLDIGHTPDEISETLYKQSGLVGVSGISPDIRDVLVSDTPDAKKAVDMYCYSIAKKIVSMSVPLGDIDLIVYTGGIGENRPEVRWRVNMYLPEKFRAEQIVVPTDEELMIAINARRLSCE